MSRLLETAAVLDAERAAALAANDDAIGAGPLRPFRVQIKQGQRVLQAFECMARSSVQATTQHLDLAAPGQYLFVSPIGSTA